MVEWLEWREGVNKGANQRCVRKKGKLYVSVIVCLTLKVASCHSRSSVSCIYEDSSVESSSLTSYQQ